MNTADLVSILQNLVLFSMPEAGLLLWFSCVWLGLKPDRFLLRTVLYAALFSVYTHSMLAVIPKSLYFLNSIIGNYILLNILFPIYKTKRRLLLYTVIFAAAIVIESAIMFATAYL